MTIQEAIAADIADRLAAGNIAFARCLALTDAQIDDLMTQVTDSQVRAIKELLANIDRLTPRVPHVAAIMAKMHNAAYERRFAAKLKRIDSLAQAKAARVRTVGWWHFREHAALSVDAYIIAAILPDAFTAGQLAKLRGPFVRVLGE